MEKKRALLVNLTVIGAILLLTLAVFLVSKATPPRQLTPNAGVLEGFTPMETTVAPENKGE